jgi:hypothetical protein
MDLISGLATWQSDQCGQGGEPKSCLVQLVDSRLGRLARHCMSSACHTHGIFQS